MSAPESGEPSRGPSKLGCVVRLIKCLVVGAAIAVLLGKLVAAAGIENPIGDLWRYALVRVPAMIIDGVFLVHKAKANAQAALRALEALIGYRS